MSMPVTINKFREYAIECFKHQLVPFCVGSPGIGKSAIYKSIAEQFNLEFIDKRLSTCDPTDLGGFLNFNKDKGTASYYPIDTFPIENTPIPEGKEGWLLLLDELPTAPPAVQTAAYSLLYDREVGGRKLHEKVLIGTAGNSANDNAHVEELSTALQSRLIHFYVEANLEEWINQYALLNGYDHRLIAYLRYEPDQFYSFDPNNVEDTFPCARTWSFLNKIVKDKEVTFDKLPLYSGTISEPVARAFTGFCQIYKDLITVPEIIANPFINIPNEKSSIFALTGSIGKYANKTNIDKLMQFINRLDVEFQIITLRNIIKTHDELVSSTPIQEWISNKGMELF